MRGSDVKFSLILPIKNGQGFVETMIKTVSEIMRSGDELIVIDDGSTDSTVRLLKPWVNVNPQVRLINNPNLGLANALNLGVREATNELIARVDVDDSYSSRRLDLQQNYLNENCVAVFSDYSVHTKRGQKIGYIPSGVGPISTAFSLISSSRTPHPSAVFRKSAFNEVGGYRQNDFPCEDLSLWLRLAKIGDLLSVPEPLLEYRLSTGGVTASKKNSMKNCRDNLINAIGLSDKVISSGFELWRNEIKSLDSFSYSNARRILLLRELRIARKMGIELKDYDRINRYLLSQVSTSVSTIPILGRLGIEKAYRKLYW